ncbi:MAG: isopenicillin-N epimerase [Gaiellaceae bacterium]|jgi:isopenicillin-N epimerase|nr:isopenicillin-N epimerase [Gaiellaceae bacterium]
MNGSLSSQFLLDPDVVFLNHGSFGATPRPVFERYQAWQRELERQPVEFIARRLAGLLDEARGVLAEYVGAAPQELAFVQNATTGVNLAARSLRLGPGDDVLGTDLEYGACDLAWERVCEETGARYVRAPIPLPVTTPEQIADSLLAGVTARTRAVFVSHVTSATALRLPVELICRRAREAGIVSIIDGAHATAHVPVDLNALGADFYAGNCHKWLCAPKGSGFLYARTELQDAVDGPIVSWGYADGASFQARIEHQGTRDPAPFLSVPAAIAWQAANDWDDVRARCRALTLEARRRLAELIGLEPLAAASAELLGQMVSVPLPPCDAAELKRRLYDEHRIEIPVFVRDGVPILRASFQGYNDYRDLDVLLEALGQLLVRQVHA